MNWICEKLEALLARHPDVAFLFDESTPMGLTAAQFYDLTGRVYAYLKAKGVGKEDFVLINLSRCVQPLRTVRGFENGEQAFLAAYYTADIPKPDTVRTREALSRRTPSRCRSRSRTSATA